MIEILTALLIGVWCGRPTPWGSLSPAQYIGDPGDKVWAISPEKVAGCRESLRACLPRHPIPSATLWQCLKLKN
jgi:hypothetical protein